MTVTDLRDEIALAGVMDELGALDIRWVLGRHDESDFTSADLIVVSPGVPQGSPAAGCSPASGGREIVSEIELAGRFITATAGGHHRHQRQDHHHHPGRRDLQEGTALQPMSAATSATR